MFGQTVMALRHWYINVGQVACPINHSARGGPKTLPELFGAGCCISGVTGGREKELAFLCSEFCSSINRDTSILSTKLILGKMTKNDDDEESTIIL
ncbi:hypothetical protein LWI28_027232 [Acer negundo]|uniref:Uncharacterized protein n=1 Tax=Acer negundo TaxID=4023 RepID=A0AAD5P3C4_ACENE|nr:hypothetical protein LWI28_027232 [Acer negundo]